MAAARQGTFPGPPREEPKACRCSTTQLQHFLNQVSPDAMQVLNASINTVMVHLGLRCSLLGPLPATKRPAGQPLPVKAA